MAAKQLIKPQPGYQEDFLRTPADIAIGGGAAGVGKTYSMLMEAARNTNNQNFGANIFRRTYPQIQLEGGLWDTASAIYPGLGAKSRETFLQWLFPSGAAITFKHLEYEKNLIDYQGAQIPLIGFDELTHFSKNMFFYLLTRNRSTCGVKPYVRATCNPDPDSWLASFLEWYIDQNDKLPNGEPNPNYGFPIKERAGKLRYFTRDSGNIVWGDSFQEVYSKCLHLFDNDALKDVNPKDLIKSITFIPGSIYQNKELLSKDPSYLANLLAQDEATKASLLEGNWKVKPNALSVYNYIKLGDLQANSFVPTGQHYITADIAMEGSDLFVIWVWSGRRIVDVAIVEKSNGKEVETKIQELANRYRVPQSNITYDADGVGSFLRGYFPNAKPFVNNSTALPNPNETDPAKKNKPENYANLKAQCYYHSGKKVNDNETYMEPEVANRLYKGKRVIDWLVEELKVIKKDKVDSDGKLHIIPKSQMKNILGRSPDYADGFMMREIFDLQPNLKPATYGFSV